MSPPHFRGNHIEQMTFPVCVGYILYPTQTGEQSGNFPYQLLTVWCFCGCYPGAFSFRNTVDTFVSSAFCHVTDKGFL